jgi:hypothetical protein
MRLSVEWNKVYEDEELLAFMGLCTKSLIPLCNLSVLCVSVVVFSNIL